MKNKLFTLKIILILLTSVIFMSALQLVLVRHKSRMVFMKLQTLQQQRDALNVEWGQLQLEQSTLAQHNRIETIAYKKLDMIMPTPHDIIIVKP
ncbi:cell division protein FtsL [Candidatus Parabeggiatoa sp. HSG14]|uniref:cell division protein FtsL n=1 Tax=Candidatus Parabeggiatoa sp. HSG14 TaxID=3055593 RepID=UPI0025A78424|nr:cell division protein FtsL [Thiotrichales bacterium HSG14]